MYKAVHHLDWEFMLDCRKAGVPIISTHFGLVKTGSYSESWHNQIRNRMANKNIQLDKEHAESQSVIKSYKF